MGNDKDNVIRHSKFERKVVDDEYGPIEELKDIQMMIEMMFLDKSLTDPRYLAIMEAITQYLLKKEEQA